MDRVRSMIGRLGTATHAARRPVLDVLVVLFVLSFARGNEHWGDDASNSLTATTWIIDLALILPLIGRRRWPAQVFGLIAAVALVQWLMNVQIGGDLAVLFSLYAVAAYETRRWAIIAAAAIAELGVVMAAIRWAPNASANAFTNALLLTATTTAALALGFYFRTRRAYLASVLERAATAERERDQQALIATATERARISREMHDIVAHSLSVMIALGDGAAIAATRSPEDARAAMLQSSALGRQALGEMRRLLGGLNGDDIPADASALTPQPGIADLDELIQQVRSAGPEVDLLIVGHPPDLAPGAQLTIYRMVQEALTNVLKHAPAATRATVTLRYGSTGVDIEVDNDDGGRPAVPTAAGPGHGLTGMRQRAAVFGGTVEAGRHSDGRWRVTTHLALEDST